jgi:hypothetical protein
VEAKSFGMKKKVATAVQITKPVESQPSQPATAKRPLLASSAGTKPASSQPAPKRLVAKLAAPKAVQPVKTAQPDKHPVKPSQQPAKPVEKPVKPVEKVLKPAEKVVKPAEKPVKPVEKPTKPTQQPAKPTQQASAPTKPPTSPPKHVSHLSQKVPLVDEIMKRKLQSKLPVAAASPRKYAMMNSQIISDAKASNAAPNVNSAADNSPPISNDILGALELPKKPVVTKEDATLVNAAGELPDIGSSEYHN